MYEIGRLATLKARAFTRRVKSRDAYDMSWLLAFHPDAVGDDSLRSVHDYTSSVGVNYLEKTMMDDERLRKGCDVAAVVIALADNIVYQEELRGISVED